MLRILRMVGGSRRSTRRLGAAAAAATLVAAAGLAYALTAGQAVGPVLAGNTAANNNSGRPVGTGTVTGSGGLTVTQGLILDPDRAPAVAGADRWVVAPKDDGTSFTAAIEMDVGQVTALCVYLQNNSDQPINATLEMTMSSGINVDVQEFSSTSNDTNDCTTGSMTDGGLVQEAQLARGRWLMKVAGGTTSSTGAGVDNNDGLRITIKSQDDVKPGFYTLSAKIAQVTG